jgi:hypothetical protein
MTLMITATAVHMKLAFTGSPSTQPMRSDVTTRLSDTTLLEQKLNIRPVTPVTLTRLPWFH